MPVVTSVAKSLPPSGTASGDLSGTYPGPTVAKVNGIAVTGTPSTGYVPTATSASAATWQAGGAAPTTHESLHGGNVSVANSGVEKLSWTVSSGPNTLLDLTTPTRPTIVTAGVYAVTVLAQPTSGMTAAGFYIATLTFDFSGDGNAIAVDSRPASAFNLPQVALSMTYYLPASAELVVEVENNDGVSALNFKLFHAFVQRIA